MKILFLSHKFNPDIGGIETLSEILAFRFTHEGHDVRILTWSEDESKKVFPFRVIRNPGLKDLFRQHAWADIVYENNPCLRLSWPAIFFGRPSVVGLHTWLKPNKTFRFQEMLKNIWLKRASQVVACSEAVRLKCWKQATTIGNPYQEDIFVPAPGVEKKGFVFLGRLVSDKGADLAIEALNVLHQQNAGSRLSLTIIGDGQERKGLEKMVKKYGLDAHINFTGVLKGKPLVECLNRHRFLLVPSLWEEPFGIVALEGMACGLLPIVSDGGGLPDAVGNAGVIFRRGDLASLVTSINELVNDPGLEKQLRNAAVIHLSQHSSVHVAQQYLRVFQQVVN